MKKLKIKYMQKVKYRYNMEKIGKIFVIKLYFRYSKSAKVVKSGFLHIFNSSQVWFLKKI